MPPIPPKALEEVYAVPPSEFTRTRNTRVAALAKSGHHDAAEALRKLRRPPATLWAVNQLARHDSKRLEAFIDAVAAARRAQVREPSALGEALRHQRAALDTLLDVARTQLTERGFGAGPDALRRISNTLQGAAVDADHADDLRHGRLTEELSAPGFEVFAGTTPRPLKLLPGGRKSADGDTRAAERDARREAARQQRVREKEERQRQRHERKAAAEAAAREVEALASKLAEARRKLSDARRRTKR